MEMSAHDLYLLFDQICPATGKIADVELIAGERMHRAGFLFPGDDDFVREVAYALGETPGLFADLPCDPQEMIVADSR